MGKQPTRISPATFRAKLKVAEAAGEGCARNAAALREVQPEDILPGDIDANLGAPWLPESDIQAFAADLFQVEPALIQVAACQKRRGVECGCRLRRRAIRGGDGGVWHATRERYVAAGFGIEHENAGDLRPRSGRREKSVVNPEATLAAKEKQKLIKEKFKSWVFTDPERTERLVRLYNDTYNNLRLRLFDGSHLDFPGMSQSITLRPHQKDAVWRIISGGNTLLAHLVGSGKTNICAAATMKLRQSGLARSA